MKFYCNLVIVKPSIFYSLYHCNFLVNKVFYNFIKYYYY